MKHLKIAYSFDVQYYFVDSDREIVPVEQTDFTDVAVAVLSDQDFAYIDKIDATGFGIPIMIIMPGGERLPENISARSTPSLRRKWSTRAAAFLRQSGWPATTSSLSCRPFSPTS